MKQGDVIGQYKILFPIKKSFYSMSYRVIDEDGNKRFLKLFNLAKLSDLQLESQINDVTEIKIVQSLNHSNIPSFVDKGETILEGQRYVFFVCDFIIGETLEAKMSRERLCTVYELKQIISGILNAIKYLHRLKVPVIHNNIQPGTVMLDISKPILTANLIGFGNAQYLDSRNRKLFADGLSPFYMAPELFRGLYSTRTDLYSIGVLMYHMLFGIVPWFVDLTKKSASDYIPAILNERKKRLCIPDIDIFELDNHLLKVVAKALNQDVDKRFQSADEFLKALNEDIEIEESDFEIAEKEAVNDSTEKKDKKGNGFADVAGFDALKKRLQSEVIDLIRNPEKYKKLRVKIPNGMLLYGPPGCGKTFIAEKFAEELGCHYMYVHCSDVASPYIHGGQEKIASIFEQAENSAPTVLFLDELDAMLADRSKQTNISEYGEVNEFLTHLNNCADKNVFVIGATNNPRGIDNAALRSGRLDIKVFVPNPDFECRKALLQLYLKGIVDSSIDFDKLSELTDGYVSRDICSLVNKAALLTAQSNMDVVTMEMLLRAFELSKGDLPSVSKEILLQHEKIRDEFEGKSPIRNPIGFK